MARHDLGAAAPVATSPGRRMAAGATLIRPAAAPELSRDMPGLGHELSADGDWCFVFGGRFAFRAARFGLPAAATRDYKTRVTHPPSP